VCLREEVKFGDTIDFGYNAQALSSVEPNFTWQFTAKPFAGEVLLYDAASNGVLRSLQGLGLQTRVLGE
jgi:hypothetical protein